MSKTKLQTLRSLQSAEKTLKSAVKKSMVSDRKSKKVGSKLRTKARIELSLLRKQISKFKKALGSGTKKRKRTKRRRSKRRTRRRTRRRSRTKRRRR